MKKFIGRYTTNTAKALKGSERIFCQVSEDGTIYICADLCVLFQCPTH